MDKKKGRGAIIGGVVGAGAGYLIGRDKDRKSGRVQPKN
ncbi:glycine zipper domain-containing protein [Pedobacter panaciterrae]